MDFFTLTDIKLKNLSDEYSFIYQHPSCPKQMIANGGNTFAFFTRNPRGGAAKAIDPADVEKLLEVKEEDLNLVMTGKVFPEKLKPYVDAISRIEYIQDLQD